MTGPIEPVNPNVFLRSIRRVFWWWPPGGRGPRQPQQQQTGRDKDLRAKIQLAQFRLLQNAFDEPDVGGMAAYGNSDGLQIYLCHPTRVLCTQDGVRLLDGFFTDNTDYNGRFGLGADSEIIADELFTYDLPIRNEDETQHVEHTLQDLDGAGIGPEAVRPDHILYVTNKGAGTMCPADEPWPTTTLKATPPRVVNDALGTNINVSVVDTGWYPKAALDPDTPWLAKGVDGEKEEDTGDTITEYAGHGTFVAGVVKCMAPGAKIFIEGVLKHAGANYESQISKQLDQAMMKRPHIVSISAGCRSRLDLGLLGFEVIAKIYGLDQGKGPLVVAAAGNDASNRKFWPAAYDYVVSVGSLDANGQISDYSNYGDWVRIYARGRDLVNAFPTGHYTCYEDPHVGDHRDFTNGLAKWSGTSFSTPIVSGVIAAQMTSRKLTDAHAAYKSLKTDITSASANLTNKPAPVVDKDHNTVTVLGPPFVSFD